MRGYWQNGTGQQSSPSLKNNLQTRRQVTPAIGLPPILCGNIRNTATSANCNSMINLDTLSFSTATRFPNFPPPYTQAQLQYQIADFVPEKYIPTRWYGFTTSYNPSQESGYAYEFLKENDTALTTAQAYDVGVKVLKITRPPLSSVSNAINTDEAVQTLLNHIDTYYNLNMLDNSIYNLPIWTGTLAQQFNDSGGEQSIVTMKQNTKYASFGKSSRDKYIYENGLYMQRPTVLDRQGLEFNNTFDVSSSIGSWTRQNFKCRNTGTNIARSDICYNSSSVYGLPFFMSFTHTGAMEYTTSDVVATEIPDWNADDLTTDYSLNSRYDLFGCKMSEIVFPNTNYFTPLPYIENHQIVHFGDGQGILDTNLINTFTYKDRVFSNNRPSRYCYIQSTISGITPIWNAIYFVIVYLKNNVINLSTQASFPQRFRVKLAFHNW